MPDDRATGDAPPSDGPPTGDALWDDWDTPLRIPAMPVLHLDGFHGPMDLLLDLVERQRIDLGRISVAALVEQFVAESARVVPYVPIERRAEWLVLAARLVRYGISTAMAGRGSQKYPTFAAIYSRFQDPADA